MTDRKRSEIIVVSDGFWVGVIGDIIMYGLMCGLLWFNHRYLSGSGFLDIVFVLIIIMAVTSKFSSLRHDFNSKEEAISWLKESK